jgi:hypothetical protein
VRRAAVAHQAQLVEQLLPLVLRVRRGGCLSGLREEVRACAQEARLFEDGDALEGDEAVGRHVDGLLHLRAESAAGAAQRVSARNAEMTPRAARLRTTLLAPRPMTLNSIMSEAEHCAACAARVSGRERAQPPSPAAR